MEGLPRVTACWVGSVDGRSTLGGRSAGLSSSADRTVLREQRAQADAILVGSRTAAIERYRRSAVNPALPFLIVSRGGSLPADIPLLQDPDADVRILSPGDGGMRELLASVRAMGFSRVLCEGGPTLLGLLIAEDLVDELVVTVAPLLAGAGEQPVVVAPRDPVGVGPREWPPRGFALAGLRAGEDFVFARYTRGR